VAGLPDPDELERAIGLYQHAEKAVGQFGDGAASARVVGLSRLAESELSALRGIAARFADLWLWADAEMKLSSRAIPAGQPICTTWASTLLRSIDAAWALRQRDAAKTELERVTRPILAVSRLSGLHPIAAEVVSAVTDLDPIRYRDALAAVCAAASRREAAERCRDLDQRLREVAPLLAATLQDPDARAAISSCLSTFENAWEWKLAARWLERSRYGVEPETVAAQIRAEDCRLAGLTERLVELRAWQSCYEDLNGDYEKQGALQAWQQLVRRIGRGKGTHVETYRRDARKYMDQCRAAIPVWIMPLQRVAETVEVQAGAFDVVIIDEASQTGPEGLILQYLGNQCIVVGDDKQISPEAPGVDLSNVRALMKLHLGGFPFAETMLPTSSLFDQAMVRFASHRVMLREHFRCMPEIIRFSNDLCYQDTVPLRSRIAA
jgi:hypothetical protein